MVGQIDDLFVGRCTAVVYGDISATHTVADASNTHLTQYPVFVELCSKELSPEYSNHTFELTYPNVADIVYSPPFSVFGQNFKLKIYPGGSANVRNHLSLFLEMEGPEDCEIRNFDYRLSLISLNNVDKTISKDYNSPFAAGSCWGYKHFVELDKIRDYVTNGKLIFALGIRAISYYEQCQLMANQIKALEKDRGLVDGSQGT